MAVALIVAAGRGERLGSRGPKALVELAGRPLLRWSLDAILATPAIERVVVALPAPDGEPPGTVVPLPGLPEGRAAAALPEATADAAVYGAPGAAAVYGAQAAAAAVGPGEAIAPDGLLGVVGGAVRSESVRLALRASGGGAPSELVLVHDAARPLVSRELIESVLVGATDVDAAIAAAPVTDTVKRVDADGLVLETLDRSELWAVQTPQVFRRDALTRALDVPAEVLAQATDDAWLVERMGGRVRVVPAPRENLKVTTGLDLRVAELLLGRGPA